MPQVGSKHFGYTPKGEKAAQVEAKKTGKKVKSKKRYSMATNTFTSK